MSDRPSREAESLEDEVTPLPLEVRTRTLLTPLGAAEISASVFCPRRERGVPLGACAKCEASAGVQVGKHGQPKAVLCRYTPPEESDQAAQARQAPGRDEALVAALAGPISGIMNRDAVCVSVDMSQGQLRALILERGFGGVPVVDAEGRPVGVVTKTDLLRSAAEGTEGPVGAIMNSLAIAVHEGMSIAQAAGLMAYEGVHRLPVVDDDWQVVGVVSALDVLHWLGQRSGYLMRAVAPHHQE